MVAPAEHDTKPSDTDDGLHAALIEEHGGDEQADADDEDDAAEDHAAASSALEGGAAQRGGELGVLFDEGALHLLEQSQFFLGELHGSSSPSHRKSRHAGGT